MGSTIQFTNSQKSWPTDSFPEIIKQEVEQLDPSLLPLQKGLSQGSYVADESLKAIIIGVSEEEDSILVKAGIFYQSVIAGCSCADDPTPIDTNQEYCVLQFTIDKKSGEASVELLEES